MYFIFDTMKEVGEDYRKQRCVNKANKFKTQESSLLVSCGYHYKEK